MRAVPKQTAHYLNKIAKGDPATLKRLMDYAATRLDPEPVPTPLTALSALETCIADTAFDNDFYSPEDTAAGLIKGLAEHGFEIVQVPTASYRLLERGEIILAGDEHLFDDAVTWMPVQRMLIDRQYWPETLQPIRRQEAGGA